MGERKGRAARRVMPWLAALLLFACVAPEPVYEGERRERQEVAIVTGTAPLNPSHPGVTARVEAVDGQVIEGGATKVELLPGRHEFIIFVGMQGREGLVRTWAELEGGRSYVIAVGVDTEGNPDAVIFEE